VNSRSLGQAGELLAIKFLQQHGYRIIQQNFKTRFGEIDIIARHRRQLVFIEVKTRSSVEFGHPEEAVTEKKLLHLKRCAQVYLLQKRLDCTCRFEVLSVQWGSPPACKLLPLD